MPRADETREILKVAIQRKKEIKDRFNTDEVQRQDLLRGRMMMLAHSKAPKYRRGMDDAAGCGESKYYFSRYDFPANLTWEEGWHFEHCMAEILRVDGYNVYIGTSLVVSIT